MKKIIATDKENLTALLKKYFENPNNMPPLNEWDVSNVINMSGLFKEYNFNEPLNEWDVSNVEDMSSMFADCYNFNKPLNKWGDKLGNVKNMSGMFAGSNFNESLNKWDVRNVKDMSGMFKGSNFNQPLNEWDVRTVEDMSSMFADSIFNQPLNKWGDKLGKVINMSKMFHGCLKFNKPLNEWGVSNVENMSHMFAYCDHFNQPLNDWGDKLGKVKDMSSMFEGCSLFDKSLKQWRVMESCNTYRMLHECLIRNQPNKLPPFITPPVVVIEQQVHKASSDVKYLKLFNFFLNINKINKIKNIENVELSAEFIKNNLTEIIKNTYPNKTELREQLQLIMEDRLQPLDFGQYNDDPYFKKTVCLSLLYVQQQSIEFRKTYIENCLKDCVTAYADNGNGSGLSCAKGILEQIILSCITPCMQYITSGEEEKQKEYQDLVLLLRPIPIQDFILEWYKEHNKENKVNFEKLGKTPDSREKSLIAFLKSKIPEADDRDEEIKDEINKLGLGYKDDVFTYSGGRKNTRRRKGRKTKKAKTRKHRKTK